MLQGRGKTMIQEITEQRMLTVQEISDYMGVTKITVKSWITAGNIKAFKIGKTYRITPEHFKEFIDQHTAEK
jgi:excisionase family DNA binding protein